MTPEELKKWREAHGLSQSGLASLLGVSSNTVARWERGEMTYPPFLKLALRSIATDLKRKPKVR